MFIAMHATFLFDFFFVLLHRLPALARGSSGQASRAVNREPRQVKFRGLFLSAAR